MHQDSDGFMILAREVAHDISNLLGIMRGHAAMAIDKLPEASSQNLHLEAIIKATTTAAELCEQMMVRSDYSDLLNQLTDINGVVTEMVCLLEHSISERCQITIDLSAKKPYVALHVENVMQVLLNLIMNAVESIGSDAGVIHISTRITTCSKNLLETLFSGEDLPKGDYAVLSVCDSGVGIPAENRVKIFEPYFSTKTKGQGIGLSSVQHIVSKYGGAIWVVSGETQGTTISIYLPIAEALE